MGHSRREKQTRHERIVRVAAKRFRERGLEGIGVADVIKEAGVTVGGFYKHFGSRDELGAINLSRAVSDPNLSREILQGVREELIGLVKAGSRTG